MKKTIRLIAAPAIFALALAGCGGAGDDAATAPEKTVGQEGGQADEVPEGDAVEPEAGAEELETYPLEGATGMSVAGAEYTLGAPEPLPEDVAALLEPAGVETDEMYVVPVTIDNSAGTETADVYSMTVVVEGGEQSEHRNLGGFMKDTADESDLADSNYDAYSALWDRSDELFAEAAPTASATDYLVFEGDPSDLPVTYVEVNPSALREPVSLLPPE